jgi:transaldolase
MQGYFHRLHETTKTRLWINNPTGEEMEKAMDAGAVSCTTNPAYCSRLLNSEAAYMNGVIDAVIREEPDSEAAALLVYQRCGQRLLNAFRPVHERTAGTAGFVTLQDDPRREGSAAAALQFAVDCSRLGRNFMAKIPVIRTGLEAIEGCVERNIPVCATEVFTVAQALNVCEAHARAARRTGHHPPLYVTHITGIFDEYLRKTAARDGITGAEALIAQAGCAVARRQYHLLKEKGFDVTMLGGGARTTAHFTEMVGGDMHVTINWNTAEEIIRAGHPVVPRIDAETPMDVLDELSERFPAFDQAWRENGLSVDEFEGYGPVKLFRNMFLEGWYALLAAICRRRYTLAR